MAQPLDPVVVVREEPRLDDGVGEVGDEGGAGDEQGDHPVGRRGRQRLLEHHVVGGGEAGRDGAVHEEEDVPEGDAEPDAHVLHQGEVAHRDVHLQVDGPHDARVGGGAQRRHVHHLPAAAERLLLQRRRAQEEDDHRAGHAVQHPSDDPTPLEQKVLRALLVQHRELHCIVRVVSWSSGQVCLKVETNIYACMHSTYLETESSRHVLVEDAHGDHRQRREEDVEARHRPVVVERLA